MVGMSSAFSFPVAMINVNDKKGINMPRLTQSKQNSLQLINLFRHGLIVLAALSVMALTLPATAQT
jgi:hypothetical protein